MTDTTMALVAQLRQLVAGKDTVELPADKLLATVDLVEALSEALELTTAACMDLIRAVPLDNPAIPGAAAKFRKARERMAEYRPAGPTRVPS